LVQISGAGFGVTYPYVFVHVIVQKQHQLLKNIPRKQGLSDLSGIRGSN
jgi:hypothetical protein